MLFTATFNSVFSVICWFPPLSDLFPRLKVRIVCNNKCWIVWVSLNHKWCPYSCEIKQSYLDNNSSVYFQCKMSWKCLEQTTSNAFFWPNWLTAVYSMRTATKWDYWVSAECKVCFTACFSDLDCSNYRRSGLNSSPSVRWQLVHAFGTSACQAGSLIAAKWVQDSGNIFVLCGYKFHSWLNIPQNL